MFFIFFCAFIGLLIDGGSGALIGGLVGYALRALVRMVLRRGLERVQARFLEATFSVMGALCKADGVVSRDEIQAAQDLFVQFRLSPRQIDVAKAAFNRGKAPDFDLDGEVERFAQSAGRARFLIQLFLHVQLRAVAADGHAHPAEHEMLVRIARRLGMSERDVAQLEALLRGAAHPAETSKARLEDAYAALGVSAEASDDEIKRAYRKLISENHPDKLAAQGLPQSMQEMLEERARQINAAYDLIKQARQSA
jgi:DnaJ like chaperone protein